MLRRLAAALALVVVAGSASAQFPDSLDPFSKGTCGAPCTVKTSIAAYWKLDEASGTRADSVGTSNLTDNNTVTQAAGKINNAALFTAANSEYLSVASDTALVTGDIDYTLAGWVYFTSDPASRVSRIVSKSDTSKREYEFIYNVSQFQWFVFDGTATSRGQANASNFGAAPASTWIFVVIWHDSVNNIVGIQVNNGTANTASTTGAAGSNTGPFQMGNRAQLDAGNYFDGRLDEWGFWKRILTMAEKTYLYAAGSGRSIYAWMQEFWFPGVRYAERDFTPTTFELYGRVS